ncbi:MAG: phosphonate C-P lyase system protein PhnH [Rhodobacteraceae bacterium]|nr:MAG: phosphonate C-P lyase system protein PhnH [Paracoccaceae bacterium]
MTTAALTGGFETPPLGSALAFRALLDVMARPGTIRRIEGAAPPAPLSRAAGAVLLTLCDPETPVFLGGAHDRAEVRDWLAFHTGAPVVGAGHCAFALGTWPDLAPLSRYAVGTPDYPDRSATLIVEMPALAAGGVTLRGPGIRDTASLPLPDPAAFRANRALFPLGLDFIFTCGDDIAALPRSVEVL